MPVYVPSHFRNQDDALALTIMREFEFATLVSTGSDTWITHLPFVVDPESAKLRGHLAKANGHAAFLDGPPATAVFSGPHAYVSPTWYEEAPAVPTWNYAVVHASGPTRHLDPDETVAHLDEVLRHYEGTGVDRLPEDWLDSKRKGIVAFELAVETLECKLKMSQNKDRADRARVVARLRQRALGDDLAVADMVERLSGD